MSNAITESKSLDEVVENINQSIRSNDAREAEEMAGQYAWEAAEESGYIDDSSVEAHLDYLIESGAKFDFEAALKNAISRRVE